MARWAHVHGIRTFYYIAPKVWASREGRLRAIRRDVDRLFVIFPFECDYFPQHGIRPIFEGNPLVDALEAQRASLPRRRSSAAAMRSMSGRSSPWWPAAAPRRSARTSRSWRASRSASPRSSSS